MATVTGLTAERMIAIEGASVVDGEILADHLILSKFDGTQIDAGVVVGPQGPQGIQGVPGVPGINITRGLLSAGPPTSPAPVEGDIWIAQTAASAGNFWQFMYHAGYGDAHKWACIGGPPLATSPSGNMNAVTNTVPTFLTGAASLVVPRSGVYQPMYGVFVQNAAGFSGAYSMFAQLVGSVSGLLIVDNMAATDNYDGAEFCSATDGLVLSAGETITIQVYSSAATPTNYNHGWMRLQPVRIS